MTRIAHGDGWTIREVTGKSDRVVVKLLDGPEQTLTLQQLDAFAQRAATIVRGLRDPVSLPTLFDDTLRHGATDPTAQFFDSLRQDAEAYTPRDGVELGPPEVTIKHGGGYDPRLGSDHPNNRDPSLEPGWEPPGGLVRPRRNYKGGRGPRR